MLSYNNAISAKKDLAKAYFNNKNVRLLVQFSLFAIIFYCCMDHGIINELFHSLEIFNPRDFNKGIIDLIISIKCMADSVQLVNFAFIIFKVLFIFIVATVLFLFFISSIGRVKTVKNTNNYNTKKTNTASFCAVYIIQSKFLC